MIIVRERKPSLDELTHFGVKGMRWGHHKAQTAGGETDRQKLKRLDKESRAKDNAARDAEIEAARQRYGTTSRDNYLKAKAQYKIDKKTIGKREALKKFQKVQNQNIDDFELATQAKSGKETTKAILVTVGSVLVAGLLGAATHR